MRITRKQMSSTIRQDNDCSCFGCGPSINRRQHNKRAKRLASKRLRMMVKGESLASAAASAMHEREDQIFVEAFGTYLPA